MSSIKRKGLKAKRCQSLAWQTERPVVRLLNAFEQQQRHITALKVGFGAHCFDVRQWRLEDSVGFCSQPSEPDVYLFRDLAMELCVAGVPVVMWLCDELALEEPPCCICPVYGEEWSRVERARLSLLFGQPVVEGSICPWVIIPEGDITLWLNSKPFRA